MTGPMIQPPVSGMASATSIANAAHAAHDHRRLHNAENLAELKAMRSSRFAGLRRLLNRVTRRG